MNYAWLRPPTPPTKTSTQLVLRLEKQVVLAQYPEFNTFFVQSASAPTRSARAFVGTPGISYQSIGPPATSVTGDEVRTECAQNTRCRGQRQSLTPSTGLSADSQLNDFSPPDDAVPGAAIGAIDAQQVDVTREKVTVGIPHSAGIDPDHKDFQGQISTLVLVAARWHPEPGTPAHGRKASLPRHARRRHDRRRAQCVRRGTASPPSAISIKTFPWRGSRASRCRVRHRRDETQ